MKQLCCVMMGFFVAHCWSMDTYNPANGQLSIPYVHVGSSIYTDVIASIDSVLSVGQSPALSAYDTYSLANNQLAIPSVMVASQTYSNVLVTIKSVISVGSKIPAGIFDSNAQLLPDLSVKYQKLCGNSVGIQTGITANLMGHKDGKKDLIFTLWCSVPAGTSTTSPTINGLIAITQNADGTFVDSTKALFGVDLLDVAGGLASGAVAYDFNNDGYDDIFISVTGEDGRTLPQGFTGNNRQNFVITSSSNGTYSFKTIGIPSYNYMVKTVNNALGGKDVMTATIGYGGADQAFRWVNGQWQAISDYAKAPTFSSSFFNSSSFNGPVDSALLPNAGQASMSLYQQQKDGSWSSLDSQLLGKVTTANYITWNKDPGTMPILTFNAVDYGFISFYDNCLMRKPNPSVSSNSPSNSYYTLFAVPAQKIVGGYTPGRLLHESDPLDFSWNLIMMGYSANLGKVTPVNLNINHLITNENFFSLKCGDLNGDGFDDFWINNWGAGQKPAFYLSDPKGNFNVVDQSRLPIYPSSFNGGLAIYEDVDGDGIKDLIYFPSTGLNTKTASIQFPLFKGLRQILPVDLIP